MIYNSRKLVLFWKGIFSNWAHTPYTNQGMSFQCAEQELMFRKAVLFKDFITADKIANLGYDPKEAKRLGRLVSNYDEAIWENQREGIMIMILRAKFMDNSHAREALLKIPQGYKFVEASPYDSIWGAGTSEHNIIMNNFT